MSDTSVWKLEVDTALASYLTSTTGVKSVPSKPEEDFKEEAYPLITFTNLYNRYDKDREFVGEVRVGEVGDDLIFEESAIPYQMYYQIDFWADDLSSMDLMTRKWLGNHRREFLLPVEDASKNKRNCPSLMTDSLKSSNLISKGKRIFHSFITYKIATALDEGEQTVIKKVSSITFNMNPI